MKKDLTGLIAELNAILIETYENDQDLFQDLLAVQGELGLLFGERPTCPFLRPHFLGRKQYGAISAAAETIAEAAERLTSAALEDETLMIKLGLTDEERRLARIDPGYSAVSATSRFDTFVDGDDFKFLEYNAETPAGVGDQIQLEKVLDRIPLIREFLVETSHWRPKPHQKLLETIVRCYREFGGKKRKPNIAIVDWEGVSTESEFYILKDYFESLGFRTLVADPSELEFDGEVLRADSFEADVVYKRLLIHEFLEVSDPGHPILRAYTKGKLCIVNSFRVKVPHKKTAFAFLTDEKYRHLFSEIQLETIRKHIPWTRRLEETKTNYGDAEIDLTEFVRGQKDTFLIKPNDDYGGKGIVLGWEAAQSVWDDAIEEALADHFVVQEKVAVRKEEFPVFGDSVKLESLLVDFDPFLFNNSVEGGMVRLSASSLVNVTQGGGQTALIVLEDF